MGVERQFEGVDHFTICVKPETIKEMLWFWLENGAKFTLRVDDVDPKGKSSMMLWCLDCGTFGVALVAGIDREEKSQVTAFIEKHGDRSIQHIALKVPDLEKYVAFAKGFGLNLRGDILVRKDDRGWVKQVFAKGLHDENPAVAPFIEFVQRPKSGEDVSTSFSPQFGTGLYKQVQDAMIEDDREEMVDFKKFMPENWEPPFADNEKQA